MNELIFKSARGNPVTISLLVAGKFEKEHKHLPDSIRDILAAKKKATNYFHDSTY